MDFSILGPLEGSSEGAPLNLGGPRQRALLAYLLLHANEVVAAERLVDDLWWEPPQGGTAAVQTQISRLRKTVGARLKSTPSGYVLCVEPDELDLHRLRGLLAAAGGADEAAERARLLREAESLWRGEPLAMFDLPFVAGERAALDELRAGTIEDRIAAELEAGSDGALLPELSALVARYPLRERLRGLLMLALYRVGRQAEALDVMRETRRVLDEQLGLEPSSTLRELERAILQQDPALVARHEPARPHTDRTPRAAQSRRRRPAALVFAAGLSLAAASLSAVVAWRQLHPARSAAPPVAAAIVPAPSHQPVVRHRARVHPATSTPKHRAVHQTGTVRRHQVRALRTTTTATIAPTTTQPTHSVPSKAAPTKTAPVQKAPTQPTTPALQPDVVTLADDFSAPATDSTMWGISNDGTGGSATQSDNRLDLALPATGAPGGRYNELSIAYFTQCRFGGDFDARVGYTLLDWPTGSGARLQLSAWIFPATNSDAARTSSSTGEQYDGDVGSTWGSLPTSDQRGVLRVARRGNVLTSYAAENGKWVTLKSGSARGQVMLGLQLFATASAWSHEDVSAAFDHFSVTAQRPTCS